MCEFLKGKRSFFHILNKIKRHWSVCTFSHVVCTSQTDIFSALHHVSLENEFEEVIHEK